MVTNETLNNNNGDKIERETEKEKKCITKCSKNDCGGVTNGEVQRQTNGRRTNERAKWWPKEAKKTFILTTAASLVASQAHGSAQLALGCLQRSQTLQDLLGISHRSGKRASPPIAVVVHYSRHISFAHASTWEEYLSRSN